MSLLSKLNPLNKRPEPGRTEAGETGEFKFAFGWKNVSRTSIIRHIATCMDAQTYLEIGVRDGRNFKRIDVPHKVGVDPVDNEYVTHCMTSDDYFRDHGEDTFDIVYIDGMHLRDFVLRDIGNALNVLNPGGVILLHDCNPPTEFHQREVYEVNGETPSWNGTVWQGWLEYRSRSDLSMQVIDTDYGVGIIQKGSQDPVADTNISYAAFDENRGSLLPLISVQDFLERFTPASLARG